MLLFAGTVLSVFELSTGVLLLLSLSMLAVLLLSFLSTLAVLFVCCVCHGQMMMVGRGGGGGGGGGGGAWGIRTGGRGEAGDRIEHEGAE